MMVVVTTELLDTAIASVKTQRVIFPLILARLGSKNLEPDLTVSVVVWYNFAIGLV